MIALIWLKFFIEISVVLIMYSLDRNIILQKKKNSLSYFKTDNCKNKYYFYIKLMKTKFEDNLPDKT